MADYRKAARSAARRYGLDPSVFERQIQQESGFNPSARSPAGAQGIAQIMPATAKGWGVDPSDPIASLNAAAKNMASYVKKYGSYRNALVAYNAGPGRVGKPLYAETANYVKTILGGRSPSTSSVRSGGGGSSAAQTPSTTTQVIATALQQPQQQPVISAPPPLPENLTPQGYAPVVSDWEPPGSDLQQKIASLSKETTTTPADEDPSTGAGVSTPSATKGGSEIKELIFNDGGKGYGIKDGQVVDGRSVFSSVWGGHADHVHVAAGPKTVVRLGKKAQQMGLHVGENPHFGGVDPGVHVSGSYHNRGQAIDVSSSDKAKMAAFARYVKRYQTSR